MGFNIGGGGTRSSGSSGVSFSTAGSILPTKNLNPIWTKKLLHNVSTGAAAIGNTFGCIIKAPCPDFTHVRLIFANAETTPGTISGIAVAVTNSNADKVTPSTGSGLTNNGATGWVQGKFSGNNGVTLPAKGADTNNPSMLASDWIQIDSLAPTDGSGNLPYLLARVRYSNAFSYLYQGMDSSVQTNSSAQYMETYHTSGNVDAIGTPTNLTSANRVDDAAQPFFAFEFISSKSGVRVVAVGDSITNGYNGSGLTAGGWWQQANDIFAANGNFVNVFQGAVGGTTTTQYNTFARGIIAQHNPAVACYSLFSPNDGPSGAYAGGLTQAIINAQYARGMDFVNYCRANSVLPVFTVLTPNNNYSAADDALRVGLVNRAKASSIPVIDLSGPLSTTGSPQQFIANASADGVHPAYSANTTMAYSFVSQLLSILRQGLNV